MNTPLRIAALASLACLLLGNTNCQPCDPDPADAAADDLAPPPGDDDDSASDDDDAADDDDFVDQIDPVGDDPVDPTDDDDDPNDPPNAPDCECDGSAWVLADNTVSARS